jgi:hypothetical protein
LADSCEFSVASWPCSLVRSPFRAADQRTLVRGRRLCGRDLRLLRSDLRLQFLLPLVRVALDRGELRLECRELGFSAATSATTIALAASISFCFAAISAFLVVMSPCRPAISVCRRGALASIAPIC